MSDDSALQAEFNRFDADNNGHIDETEFAQLVKSLGVELSANDVAIAFLAIDVSGNGAIEFREFSSWWRKRQG